MFCSKEVLRLDLCCWWHLITKQLMNSLSSWERSILSQMFVGTIIMLKCLILYICGHTSDSTPESNDLDGWLNTFGNLCNILHWVIIHVELFHILDLCLRKCSCLKPASFQLNSPVLDFYKVFALQVYRHLTLNLCAPYTAQ